MAKVYENEFKVMIIELLNSGRKLKEVSDEYSLNEIMLWRWKREYFSKSGDSGRKRALSKEEQELKALKKELREVTLE